MSFIQSPKHERDCCKKTVMCLVCLRSENAKCVDVDLSFPWLCDRCRTALLKIVESEDTPDGKRTYR